MGIKTDAYLSRTVHRKRKRRRWIILFLVIIGLSFAGVTGYASFKINHFMENIYEEDTSEQIANVNQEAKDSTSEKELNHKEDSFAILLLGEDYRKEIGTKNTDAIIISIWNPNTKEIHLLSVPRDTKVEIPGHGSAKINSVFAKDGPYTAMKILSDYFHIPISYYVKIDFQGFVAVIDQLGGIEIEVERNMFYHDIVDGTDINLKKGLQTLNGKQALDYARFRKSSDGNDSSDFERNQRHQKIIKAVADQLVTIKGVTSIFDLLDIVGNHVKTNLKPEKMKDIFLTFKGIQRNNIQSIAMNSYWKNPYVYIDQDELVKVQNELKRALERTSAEIK